MGGCCLSCYLFGPGGEYQKKPPAAGMETAAAAQRFGWQVVDLG
jgi:hypothetical protein